MNELDLSTQEKLERTFPETATDGLPATALGQEFYTSEDVFALDLERIFRRRWLFACHLSELPASGDYQTFEIGEDSIIVTRDRDDIFHAFHNVCRHRGARLCTPGRGNAKAFVCPFHAWTYNSDGSLRAAPLMGDIDKGTLGAKRVWCETWNGLVFINLQEDQPKPVSEYMAGVDFSGHRLDRAKVIETREYLTNANWKINGETYQECYHCTVVHGNSLAKILSAATNHDAYQDEITDSGGNEFLIYSPDLRNGAFKPSVETETRDGKYITKRLLGDGSEPQPPRLVSWFPSFSLGAFPDFAFIIDWIPVSARKTIFRTRWLVHEEAVEGVDYTVADGVELADTFNREDKEIVERQQAGVNSSVYVPGPYHVPLEHDTRKYIAQYLDLMKRPGKAG